MEKNNIIVDLSSVLRMLSLDESFWLLKRNQKITDKRKVIYLYLFDKGYTIAQISDLTKKVNATIQFAIYSAVETIMVGDLSLLNHARRVFSDDDIKKVCMDVRQHYLKHCIKCNRTANEKWSVLVNGKFHW